MDEKNYIKIRTSVPLERFGEITQDQIKEIYEEEEKLREKLILPINEAIGLHNWALQFTILYKDTYFADIYVNNSHDYDKIVEIVKELITNRTLSYWYKGTIRDYIQYQ